MSQSGSAAATMERENAATEIDSETLSMSDETPGMDQTTPITYTSQASDPKPEPGTHSPDEAQNGQNGGGTSDGDEGSS